MNGNLRHGRRLARAITIRPRRTKLRDADIAVAVLEFASDFLPQRSIASETAKNAMERLRGRLCAAHAAAWVLTPTYATCAVRADERPWAASPAVVELRNDAVLIERLRRQDALLCSLGQVSGVEDLIPPGVSSFLVATGPASGVMGVLVIGWSAADPLCDESAVPRLRVAAALLQRALADRPSEHPGFADAVLGSLADPIAVVDRDGTIVGVNTAWTMRGCDPTNALPKTVGAGENYWEIWRALGLTDAKAAAILENIQDVARGESPLFQSAYTCFTVGEERRYLLTATPLQHPGGGAVIVHTLLTPEKVTSLARGAGEGLFHRIADAMPLPIWMLASDGRLLYGNQRWRTIAATGNEVNGADGAWADAFHVDDRERALAAFRAAVTAREGFDLELRLRAADGSYSWASCCAAPLFGADGLAESYVGFCWDIRDQRNAEWELIEIASKLVTAQESERSRIGRELHDGLGQQAALLAAKLETLAHNARLSRVGLRSGIVEAEASLQELAVAIHSLSHQLHPAKLKLLGLVKTVESLCRDVSKGSSIRVSFSADGVPARVPEAIALCAFRVVQEALQNTIKHSEARAVDVNLSGNASQLVLRVSDTGRGFDPFTSEAAGIGLLTMRERVELAGGTLRIEAAQAAGTTITATLPLHVAPLRRGVASRPEKAFAQAVYEMP